MATVHGVTELDTAEELSRNMRGADMTGFDGNIHMEYKEVGSGITLALGLG